MAQLTQPSFAAGELSPSLYSRTDLAKYHIGVRTMLNWYVHPQGGTSNCPGTAWVGEVIDSADAGRLIGFQFSTVQTYALEFGDLKMRIIKDGGYVLEAAKTVTAVTRANPGKVTVSGSHGFATGDRLYLAGLGGMTQLNGRHVDITVTSASEFTVGVDTTGFSAFTSGGSAARLYTLTTPYALSDLATLKYEQSADTLTLTHKNHAPRKLTRTDHADWTLSTIVFAPVQIAPTGVASSSAGTAQYYAVTAINDETGEESLQSADAGSSNETSNLTWAKLTGCSTYSVYKKKNGVYGFIGTAQAPASGSTVTFSDATIVPDTATTPPQQRNPFANKSIGSVTVDSGGSGYVSPTLAVSDPSGLGSSAQLTANVSGGVITSVDVVQAGKGLIAPTVIITDGAGSGALIALSFTPDGGTKVVGTDGDGQPVMAPTYFISGGSVVAGGSGYSAGTVIHTMYAGYEVGYAPTVDIGGSVITAVVTGDAITGVTIVNAGSFRFADFPYYGFPTAFATDSAGTGAALTLTLTNDPTVNPGVSTYHDGRQWFAATAAKPQTMWGSVAGNFNNMSQSQPTRDSDAITRTLASRQVNDIRHMISLTQMIVLTGGAEWKVSAGTADVITPAQFVARPQSYNGSSDIRPIVANDTLLYIPPNKRKVRSLQYQWAQDSWTGTDLSLLAAHLFEANTVVDWAYARDPDSICWAVRDDGVALAFTFLTEQQLYAWSRRTTTAGAFESVCAIQEGDETAVYFIVRRTIDGQTKRHVERLHTRVFDTIEEAWFLDSALQYSGAPATVISGLWHLAGEEVWALADGIVRGPLTVSAAGQVTLPAAASLVTVGKIIPDADLELLDIDGQDQAGTWTARKRKINHLTVALKNSANTGLVAGPSGGQGAPTLYALKPKDMVNPLAAAPGAAPALVTDFMHQIAAPQWDWHGRALFRVRNSPLPYTITGITPDVSTG
ncbi:ubiquitin-activating E1 FCCH domain-containing protein [Reyranella sp.]|uniref:ubiquitin-activating E1 FCCH domain-containing protein n=1 Tax=Reyranella sp. TaxID=1929291 RepID=UPI003D09806E